MHNFKELLVWRKAVDLVLEVYRIVKSFPDTERFNLNTRTDVLSEPARRLALTRFVREVMAASARIRAQSTELIPSLAPHVGLTARAVAAVWRQFRFPASLSNGMSSSLPDVEAWVAVTQTRQPRRGDELTRLIDRTVLAAAQAHK